MNISRMSALTQRLLVGAGTVITVLFCIYFSTTPYIQALFPIITTAFISTAVWEYCQMAHHKGNAPLSNLSIIGTVLFIVSVFFSTQTSYANALPQIVLLLSLAATFFYYFFKGKDPLNNIALTLFPIGYLAMPLSCILMINYFEFSEPDFWGHDGRVWLLYAIATTKMTDIGGYFFGKLFGSRLLSPIISPKKTWEGAIGGLICAVITSVAFTKLIDLSVVAAIILGVCIAILAQFGDLAESILKRDTGVKDSSHIPGLGGTLDIVDSLVFTLPFVYLFLVIVHGGN